MEDEGREAMLSKYLVYISILLLMHGCSSKEDFILFNQANKDLIINDSNQTEVLSGNIHLEYKIIPHDRISVIVYQHPEFSTSALESRSFDRGLLVNADGNIRLPLIKSVHVAGLTQTEALEKVEDQFKNYLKSPDIYLEVLNKRAYVIGEVNQPGEIELTNEKLSLIQAIAKAGDLTDSANRQSILILRNTPKGMNRKLVNLTDINSLTMSNLLIRPNDIVYVLPDDIKTFNVNVNEINPVIQLIANVLSPFVSIKYLSSN